MTLDRRRILKRFLSTIIWTHSTGNTVKVTLNCYQVILTKINHENEFELVISEYIVQDSISKNGIRPIDFEIEHDMAIESIMFLYKNKTYTEEQWFLSNNKYIGQSVYYVVFIYSQVYTLNAIFLEN